MGSDNKGIHLYSLYGTNVIVSLADMVAVPFDCSINICLTLLRHNLYREKAILMAKRYLEFAERMDRKHFAQERKEGRLAPAPPSSCDNHL